MGLSEGPTKQVLIGIQENRAVWEGQLRSGQHRDSGVYFLRNGKVKAGVECEVQRFLPCGS